MKLRNYLMSHERPDGSGNEWESLDDTSRYNLAQKMAAKTKGFFGPASLVTLAGIAKTLYGSYAYANGNYVQGLGLTLAGRADDLLDGLVAKATKTRSKNGALLDASADKIGAAAALGTLTYTRELHPALAVGAAITQGAIAIENAKINQRGAKATPNLAGKIAMFALSSGSIAYMGASALHERDAPTAASEGVRAIGHIAMISGVVLGGIAAVQYHQQANSLPGIQQEAE